MSSIVILQQSDAVHFITDGASYGLDGVVTEITSKVVVLPNANCAFALRGGVWPKHSLEAALNLAPSFDGIVEMLPDLIRGIRAYYSLLRDAETASIEGHFEISVGGWSGRMQRMAAVVASTWNACDPHDPTGHSHIEGYEPYAPWLPGQGYTAPPVDFETVLGRPFLTQEDVDGIDPANDGLALHTAQRIEGGVYGGKATYLVGGFAELTTIRRDSITQRVLHEWPDVVGETIAPEGAPAVAVLQSALETKQAADEAILAAQEARQTAYERFRNAYPLSLIAS